MVTFAQHSKGADTIMPPGNDQAIAPNKLLECMEAIGIKVIGMRYQGLTAQEKTGFRDIVTEADLASEATLTDYVEEYHSEDGIRGEEGTTRVSRSGFEWVFDPIDATTNYASGLPFFGISAGRVKDGKPVFGVIHFPVLEKTFVANHEFAAAFVQEGGSRMTPLHKREAPQTLRDAVVLVDDSQGRPELRPAFYKACRGVRVFGCFVYEAMLVAQGQIGVHINTGATPFDMAAAIFIAEKMSCIVSQLDGSPVDLSEKKTAVIISANEALHMEALELCRKA